MPKVIEVRKALVACEQKITEQVKRRSNRDRVKIKELQAEHAKLTNSLASILKDNREETVDKNDNTGEVFSAEQEEKQKNKRLEFENKKREVEQQTTDSKKENVESEKLKKELVKLKADLKKEKEELVKEQKKKDEAEKQRKKDLNLKDENPKKVLPKQN